jgi:hypothetical protein
MQDQENQQGPVPMDVRQLGKGKQKNRQQEKRKRKPKQLYGAFMYHWARQQILRMCGIIKAKIVCI